MIWLVFALLTGVAVLAVLAPLASRRASQDEAAGDVRADLLSALLNLGYHRALAEKAVDAALKLPADAAFEQRLKEALLALSR